MQKIKGFKNLSLSLIVGLVLASGLTFAWNAVWHGTDWVQSGKIITPKEIGENFAYLKQEIDGLKNATSNTIPTCAGYGKALQWDGTKWICKITASKFGSGVRCPGDKFVAFCGYNPTFTWEWNTCYSRGHAEYYGESIVWNQQLGGYCSSRNWGVPNCYKMDVICE